MYKGLYKNIELKVYGVEKQIEYDWIVKPGGNSGEIRFEYKNVKGTRIDNDGNLIIESNFGELLHKCPVSYQEIDKKKIIVKAEFKKISKNMYGFEVNEYDRNYKLIIDPVVLAYSTYLGGNDDDYGSEIAADSSGNAYVTGQTDSNDFPTINQCQNDELNMDIFVTKIDTTSSGVSSLIYSTYLGGDGYDSGYGIAVDSSGNVCVTGWTDSTNFPNTNQYQNFQGGGADAFVTRLEFDGPLITVTSPNGGESWSLGSTKNITWDALGISGNVRIVLLKDGTRIGTIADNIGSASGSYSWTVGQYNGGTAVPGTGYKVKVKEKGTTNLDHSNNPFTISSAAPPQISLNRTEIYFGAATSGISTSSQSLFVDNSGGGTLNWSITDDSAWLNCSPSSGTNAGSVTVSVDVTGLSAGTYTGTITVSDATATNSPQTVSVTLNVYG